MCASSAKKQKVIALQSEVRVGLGMLSQVADMQIEDKLIKVGFQTSCNSEVSEMSQNLWRYLSKAAC